MSARHPLAFIESRLVRDATTLQLSGVMNQASQLVSSIVIAFLLGAHGQGQYAVATMLQALLYNLVNVGVVQATVSQVAAASARDLKEKVAAWLALLVKSYFLFSALLIGLGWLVLPRLAVWWYEGELGRDSAHELGLWAWWLTFWILIDTPRAVAQVAFQGTRRMLALGQLDNGHELIRAFLVILGAAITGSAEGAVLGEIASRALAAFLAFHMYHGARGDGGAYLPSMLEVLKRVPEIPLRQGLRLGVRVGVIKNTTTLVVTVLPRLVLGGSAGFAWVAYFHVAQRIMGLPLILMQGVSRTILPALSERRGLKDLAGFRRLYWRTTWIAGASISAGILVGLAFVKPFVELAYPSDFGPPVFVCCAILALGVIPSSFAVAQDPFYILTDRMRPNLIICLIGALVTIPANLVLVRLDPATGPVWGQTLYLAWVLVHFGYIAHYFRNVAKRGAWES
jgi:O-antigen/teichoic acid export membrane protein